MKTRERQYQDAELANREMDFFIYGRNFPEKNIHRTGAVLYITYHKEEYVGKFHSEGGRRYFSFYLENPTDNILTTLEKEFMTDKIFDEFKSLKKGNLDEHKEVFKKKQIKEEILYYGNNKIPSVVAITEIIELPLGNKGHLSDNFAKWLFEYTIQPFILTVEKHKSKSE